MTCECGCVTADDADRNDCGCNCHDPNSPEYSELKWEEDDAEV
jgi:hypothetical protein